MTSAPITRMHEAIGCQHLLSAVRENGVPRDRILNKEEMR